MAATTALNPNDVLIGTSNGPGIWIAPEKTAAPADAKTAPAAAWSTLGYLSEDGVTFSVSTDSEKIMSWQSKSPLRQVITGRELNAEFTMLEVNEQNLALYFGQKVATPAAGGTPSTTTTIEVRSDSTAEIHALLIDVKDGDEVVRFYFPRATLTDAGDLEITQSGAIGLPVTLSALDDAGVLAKIIKGSAK